MIREALLVFLGTLISLKVLYELRDLSWIGSYLTTWAALLLVYPPVIHTTLRKIHVRFFEKDWAAILKSFGLALVTCLVIFPTFLWLNDLYQHYFLGRAARLSWSPTVEGAVVQILLVALPEEFFFRGYLQTILSKRFHKRISWLSRIGLKLTWAVPVTSLLFALSHSLIAFQWWHFAIFFPSLVFGWLRERTEGLVAPILFHAASNLVVHWIGAVYR